MKKIALFIGIIVALGLAAWHMHRSDNSAAVSSSTSGSGNSTSASTGSNQSEATYKDGTYTGSIDDAFYGNVQVQVVIASGKIRTVTFLHYPNDNPTSVSINQEAMAYLRQEVIQTQNAHVDVISGATLTSQAFIKSLSTALQKA